MKRLIAVSDSHGMSDHLRDAIDIAVRRGPINVLVFLGDGHKEFEKALPALQAAGPKMRIVAVRGNNDILSSWPLTEEFFLERRKVFATHGHMLGVKMRRDKLCYAARERGAEIALYGHTHMSRIEEAHGVLLINPGAVCESSRGASAFAEVLVGDDGSLKANLIDWNGFAL